MTNETNQTPHSGALSSEQLAELKSGLSFMQICRNNPNDTNNEAARKHLPALLHAAKKVEKGEIAHKLTDIAQEVLRDLLIEAVQREDGPSHRDWRHIERLRRAGVLDPSFGTFFTFEDVQAAQTLLSEVDASINRLGFNHGGPQKGA